MSSERKSPPFSMLKPSETTPTASTSSIFIPSSTTTSSTVALTINYDDVAIIDNPDSTLPTSEKEVNTLEGCGMDDMIVTATEKLIINKSEKQIDDASFDQ